MQGDGSQGGRLGGGVRGKGEGGGGGGETWVTPTGAAAVRREAAQPDVQPPDYAIRQNGSVPPPANGSLPWVAPVAAEGAWRCVVSGDY